MQNVDHRTICKFPDRYFPGYVQVLDCLEDIRNQLAARPAQNRQQQEKRDEGHPDAAAYNKPAGICGGNAIGADATSSMPGGMAVGGSAAGGNVEVASTYHYSGGVPLAGGDGRGGSATGDYAIGGSAVGGTVRLG